jgi:hypothetical protein
LNVDTTIILKGATQHSIDGTRMEIPVLCELGGVVETLGRLRVDHQLEDVWERTLSLEEV